MLIALLIVLMLVSLLAIPVTLRLDLASGPVGKREVRVSWAFGLVNVQVAPGSSQRTELSSAKKARSGKRRSGSGAARLLLRQSFRRRFYRYVCDLWHAVRKEGVYARLRIGLGDPADTGRLWSVLGPLSGVLACAADATLLLEPEFADAAFDWEGRGRITAVPLHLLVVTALFLLSPAVWRGFRQLPNAAT